MKINKEAFNLGNNIIFKLNLVYSDQQLNLKRLMNSSFRVSNLPSAQAFNKLYK